MSAPVGVWLIAGTSAALPYPCRCETWREGGCSAQWCPCSGRIDKIHCPVTCCAWINTPQVAAAAQAEYAARRALGRS